MVRFCLVVLALAVGRSVVGDERATVVEGPVADEHGILTYTVTSPYQRKANAVEVLLPEHMSDNKSYRVLYILPVNDGIDGPWGSGIHEAKRHNLHNIYDVICVAPAYDETPWFGDHPSDPTLRQEGYLLHVVIPLIEERYPVLKGKEGRLLLGFSKSGFGAVTILLRNLDVFASAAAWDAPLTNKSLNIGEVELELVFATQENYEKYHIPTLIEKQAPHLEEGPPRLVLVSNGTSQGSIAEVHRMLTALEIPHLFKVDEKREHNWTSGWFPVTAKLLLTSETKEATKKSKRR